MKHLKLNHSVLRTALLVLLTTLGIGNVWADHGQHYGRANVAVASGSTGAGTVYLMENSTQKTQSTGWQCFSGNSDGSRDKDSKSFSCTCEGWTDGYYFAGWSTNGSTVPSSYTSRSATANLTFTANSTSSPGDLYYYAWILGVKPTGASGDVSFGVDNLSTTYTKTVSFTQTGGDAQADFNNATIALKSGGGTWTHVSTTYNSSTKKVDVQFTYTANRSSWTNAAGNRSDKATLTLSSKGGESYAAEISANLPNVTITAGTGSSVTMDNAAGTKSGSVTFPVTYVDAKEDLNTPTIAKTSGEGTWAITGYSYSSNTVTVNYSHTGSGTYGTRASAATITLTAKAGGASNTCNVTASYPALAVTGGEDTGAYPLETEDATGTATFFVSHADALADFTIPTAVANSTGGTWTVDASSAVYTQSTSDPSSGTVAISYTYNAGDLFGAKTAELTLTGTNGSSYVLTLTGERAAAADQDVSVTTAGGVETKYDTWAEGLAAANQADGCTLKLLRDVSGLTASQEITKTMTLDLNHHTLSGTLSATGGLIKLNTAGKTLTITDSKSDGAITVSGNVANRISAVEILKGLLVVSKVTLTAENANTGDTQANIYCATVYLAAGTIMSMTSGNIYANRTGASGKYCFGIYCDGAGSTAAAVNLTGGTISASFANGTYAEGIYSTGTSLIQNMDITASAKQYSYAIWVEDGHLTVNGGTYSGTTSTNGARAIYTHTHPDTKNALVVNNATLNATAGTTDARGLFCQSRSTTTTAEPTDANIILSNVTINAKTEGASATTDAYAIYTYDAGVCLFVNSGTYNATTKTTTATALYSKGYSAILGGTFNATATTTTARGLHVAANIAAVKGGTFTAVASTDLANGADIESGAKLLTYGGAFTGRLTKIAVSKYAIGANVKVGGTLEAQGGTFVGEAANSTLTAKQTSFACGVYGVEGKSTINMSNATMRGELQSNYLTNGTDSQWNGGAYGFYSRSNNPCALTNCTITAISAYQGGFGLRFAYTPAEIRNCTVTVNTTYAYNYGIFEGGACDVKVYNSKFTCTSGTTWAYGIYAYNGTIYAENSTFDVTTQRTGASSADNCSLFGVKVNAGKSAILKGCTITATGSGAYSNNGYGIYVDGSAELEDCKVTVSNINSGAYAICNTANTTRIGVASGKFKATATSTGVSCNGTAAVGKQYLYGGYYNTKNNLEKYLPEGYGMEILPNSSPEYQEGYRYAIRANTIIDPVCKIGTTPYTTLEEALEFVNQNTGTAYTITMVKGYTLPAGDYTLPAKATLLVPYNGQTAPKTHPERVYAYTTPSANIKLTFAANAHMDVLGTIEVGSKQAANGQTAGKNGCPHESYGWIYMNAGSSITLEDGAQLYAWGYITGEGEIDAKRNSTVHEMFQLLDWRGGSASSGMIGNSQRCMPVNQYAIQNIECPIKFRPGSAELCDGTVNASSSAYPFNDVKLIGIETTVTDNKSLFMMKNEDMSEDTWVRKRYDATKDQQIYEVNSSAYLGGIRLKVGNIPLIGNIDIKSTDYVMPITNNMKIHVLTGKLEITQDMELTPGAEIEIDKEATAYIQSGTSLYVFDLDEWDPFSYDKNNNPDAHSYKVPYSPTKGSISQKRVISKDADLNIHGKIVVTGNLYTTAGGANVFSTNEDAGTITYNTAASASDIKLYVCNNTSKTYNSKTYYPAWLKNGAEITPVYSETNGTAKDKSWIYYNDQWNCWEENGCFGYDAQNNPYAKPRAWVQLTSNEADANHLYHDAATGNRAFIVEEGCTWWEVEPTPYDGNKYKCVDPDYDGRYKYYEYKDNKWQEAKVTITWKNGSTTLATYSNALYGVRPTYLDVNPSKSATSTEYYSWIGWTKGSVDGKFFAKDADLDEAFEETTYYACFETHKYQYAVMFKNYDGSVLQGTPWEVGQVPYYTGSTPEKPATAALVYAFTGWSPATFTAVTGSGDVYTAQFDTGTPRTYTVQWVNYNGTVLKEEQVAYGSTPTEPTTPTRPNDAFYTYTFNSWTPAVSSVTGNQTYTATYDYEKKVTKYSVTFKNGSTTIYTQNLVANSVPVFDGTLPTKAADAQYTYSFDGWSTTEGGLLAYAPDATLPALTANVTYYAHFATTGNTYTIRWKSVDDKITYETDTDVPYGATPEYNGSKPTKARQGATVYTFDGWSAMIGGAKIALPFVTGHATYYAHFSDKPVYTVTFNVQGHGAAPANQEVVSGENVTEPAAPSAAGWTFEGWYKEAGCTNAWNFSSDVVTAATELFAKWTFSEIGDPLDIVDWTWNGTDGGTLKLNLNGIPAAGWPYEINGTKYYQNKTKADEAGPNNKYRPDDRTLTISYTGDPDGLFAIVVKKANDEIYSSHTYTIPHINNISGVDKEGHSVIYVNSGTAVTVSSNTTVNVNAIYVAPGAELKIAEKATLNTQKLVLRTTPWQAAILDNQGTIEVTDQVYYTRIIADNSQYYQFAIPLSSDVKNVRLSDGSKCTYNKSWMLKSYNEESRANNGAVNTETISNWDLLTTDGEGHATILSSVGYEMFSNTPYYREYYFPVTLPTSETTEVGVSYHLGNAGKNHAGWNALCSPLMRKFTQSADDPSDRMKISELNPDGSYQQTAPKIIYPAVPFYYQASDNGKIYFNNDAMVFYAPRRAWNTYIPTQWLQLAIHNLKGDKLDETSIYAHPEKFAPEYEAGYDVAKQSLTGGKALLYSELPCGKLAFAAVPDSIAEARIPLTAYASTEGEYVFSMVENDYLGRLKYVFLHDTQTGLVVDLLERDCAVNLEQGTNAGRFYIQCVFDAEAPEITTGVNHLDADNDKAQKIIYNNKVYIIYQGRVYDMTGRQCELR